MSAKVQIIERDGRPEYAVVPYADYEEMRQLAEAMRDIRDYDAALADTAESVPHALVKRLVEGESPARVWREHRGLTLSVLASEVGIDKTYLSQIESGRKTGSVAVLRRLAQALSVDLDDLIPVEEPVPGGR